MLRSFLSAFVLMLLCAPPAAASSYPIDGVAPVVSPDEAKALKAAGISTTEALVERGASPKGRQELARTTRLSEKRLREIVDAADLMRVKGIGPKMVRLLAKAKVTTLASLAKQDAAKLAASIEKCKGDLEADLREKLPDKETLSNWIGQAKALKPLVR